MMSAAWAVLVLAVGAEAFGPQHAGLLHQRHAGASARALSSRPSLRVGRTVGLKMSDLQTETKNDAEKTAAAAGEPPKENMMTKVKAAGVAGLASYALWEFAFWTISVPAAIYSYHATTGEWPSFDDKESTAKVSAVIFGFLNIARALVPVRIALTLATAPAVDKYIIKPLNLDKKKAEGSE